jgi:hypothetical protein
MTDRTIYALKGTPDWATEIHESLRRGEARFGWSYVETADLHHLARKIESTGWNSLSGEEKACYHHFLLGIVPGDDLIYINVPTWGQCTIARVTRPYFWRWEQGDFNHRLGVDPASVKTFGRNDNIVHPALSARLKLMGRWWRIDADEEVDALLAHLEKGTPAAPSTPADNLAHLAAEIDPLLLQITRRVHHTHPNYRLEHLLGEVLKRVPGVRDVHVQGGAGDRGADIVMVVEEGHRLTTPKQTTCVVQVKSYQGIHSSEQAVDDIRRAFHAYPHAGAGIIFSTADGAGPELDAALERVRTELNKPVTLFIGAEVALFILQYGAHLISHGPAHPA